MSTSLWNQYPRWQIHELEQNTVTIAQTLLGSLLLHRSKDGLVIARITETEAYGGTYQGLPDDASHAYRGQTPRNAPMFAAPGIVYIYLIYGMHHCLNIVTEPPNTPAAVLIRAATIIHGEELVRQRRPQVSAKHYSDGPGKLCQALGLTRLDNQRSLLSGHLQLRHAPLHDGEYIEPAVRQGIDYARHGKYFPWRFFLRHSQK